LAGSYTVNLLRQFEFLVILVEITEEDIETEDIETEDIETEDALQSSPGPWVLIITMGGYGKRVPVAQ